MDKLSSPEQLDRLITITSPMFWIGAAGGGLITKEYSAPDHPAVRNAESKLSLLQSMAERSGEEKNKELAQKISDYRDRYLEELSSQKEGDQ